MFAFFMGLSLILVPSSRPISTGQALPEKDASGDLIYYLQLVFLNR